MATEVVGACRRPALVSGHHLAAPDGGDEEDSPAVPGYHLTGGDFSRWITGTLAGHRLGRHLAAIGRDLSHRHAAELERARQLIINTIGCRYPRPHQP
jgi:hypothetical protein